MKYYDFIHDLDIFACLSGKSCQWDCPLLKDVEHRSTLVINFTAPECGSNDKIKDSESLTCVRFDLCGLCL